MRVALHIFETPAGQHPLIYEETITSINDTNGRKKKGKWITSFDLEYMTLIMIYALLRYSWKRNVLVIGLIKDTAPSELLKTIVPILGDAQKIKMDSNMALDF